MPATASVADLVDRRAERLEEAAQRHVLAERHAADLVVAARDLAVGRHDDLGVGDPAGLAGHVLGDADGERHAEAARLGGDRLELLARREVGGVDDVLRPQHEVERRRRARSSRVASRCRSVTTRVGTSSALVPCSPPPCTAMTSSVRPVSLPRGATTASSAIAGAVGDAAERQPVRPRGRPRRSGAEGEADLHDDPRDQDHAADAGDAGERPADLADAEAGERHAAEREREAHRLDQRVGGRAADDAPPAGSARSSAATPWNEAKITHDDDVARGSSAATSSRCPSPSQAKPKSTPCHQRVARPGDAPRAISNSAMPTNASGHQPHGGIASATRNPPPSASAGRPTRAARGAGWSTVGLCAQRCSTSSLVHRDVRDVSVSPVHQ